MGAQAHPRSLAEPCALQQPGTIPNLYKPERAAEIKPISGQFGDLRVLGALLPLSSFAKLLLHERLNNSVLSFAVWC